jgi:CDP-diglyceride synthetase
VDKGTNDVDDGPDQEDDVTRTDVPVTRHEHTGPSTDRVRIVGAEPAGEITGELPVVPRLTEDEDGEEGEGPEEPLPVAGSLFDQPSVHLTDEPGDLEEAGHVVDPVKPGETAVPSGTAAPTELPHWTEPPTGQVPAVLSRDTGDDLTGPGIVAPSWREEDADWVAHDEEFEPAMFADDEVALGSLDETNSTDIERRPWEFDLDSEQRHPTGPVRRVSSGADATDDDPEAATAHPITEPGGVTVASSAADPGTPRPERAGPVSGESGETSEPPASQPSEPSRTATAAASAAAPTRRGGLGRVGLDPGDVSMAADDPAEEELFAETTRPTGSARLGRTRRAGLLPARMRAKRPEDVGTPTDAPLAAEPPGASVTEVPGAGRKRGGVAELAAADRTSGREGDPVGSVTAESPGDVAARADVVAAAATGSRPRRILRRRPAPPRPAASGVEPTGGGPPAPGRKRPAGGSGRPATDARGRNSSIGLRVGTGIAVAVVALLAFKLGTVPSLVLSLIVVTFAAGECFGVLRRAGYHPATLLGLAGTVSLMVGAYVKGVAALPLVLVLITAFTLIWYLFGIERGSPVAGTAATLLTVGWVSLLGAYAGLLLSPSTFPDRHGIAFLLGAIIATVANDIGALVIGGWLGSRPLAPKISPNKTWEGLFGGAVFSILFSTVVVGSIHPWSAANAALLGVVVAVVAPLGDLCESLLKRDLRLKDMGTLLPGHGGVLDRVDALLFVLPATYYLVRALNIA